MPAKSRNRRTFGCSRMVRLRSWLRLIVPRSSSSSSSLPSSPPSPPLPPPPPSSRHETPRRSFLRVSLLLQTRLPLLLILRFSTFVYYYIYRASTCRLPKVLIVLRVVKAIVALILAVVAVLAAVLVLLVVVQRIAREAPFPRGTNMSMDSRSKCDI